jgi:hypothetical protein
VLDRRPDLHGSVERLLQADAAARRMAGAQIDDLARARIGS